MFCQSVVAFRLKAIYPSRFTFQSLLATRNLYGEATHAYQLLEQWETAVTILRGIDNFNQRDPDLVRFYSTCSDNPIFDDIPSAVLSEAVASYLGLSFLTRLIQGNCNTSDLQLHSPSFWVALCACVLGDLQLFETYLSKLTLEFENFSIRSPLNLLMAKVPVTLLKVAIRFGKSHIVRFLLEQDPSVASKMHTDYETLRAAIFSDNNEVLKALLEYTPNLPVLLTEALGYHGHHSLLTRSSSSSETIRLLTRHFAPLSAESRTWLIT